MYKVGDRVVSTKAEMHPELGVPLCHAGDAGIVISIDYYPRIYVRFDVARYDNDPDWYVGVHEIVPIEIYNTPLFQALQEDFNTIDNND